MKIIFSIIIFSFSYSVYANRYLDSTETHPYLKLTFYPFLFPKGDDGGSFAFGPSVSISGERLEIQIGILYDIKKIHWVVSPCPLSKFSC